MRTRRGKNLKHPKITTLDAFTDAVEACKGRIAAANRPQIAGNEKEFTNKREKLELLKIMSDTFRR